MIPALHCAMTSAGQETMNNGEPMTGRRSLPWSEDGSDMEEDALFVYT